MSDTAITKQILLTRPSPAYWRVTFNHPPLNIFGPDAILQLNEIITEEAPSLDAGGAALPGAAMGLHRAIPPVNPANPKTTGTPGLFRSVCRCDGAWRRRAERSRRRQKCVTPPPISRPAARGPA